MGDALKITEQANDAAPADPATAAAVDHPARWWHALPDGRIQCDLCPRDCRLHEGQRGLCFVRYADDEPLRIRIWQGAVREAEQLVDEWQRWLEQPDPACLEPL